MNKIVDGDDLNNIRKKLIDELRHTRAFISLNIEYIKDAVSEAILKYLLRINDEDATEEFESSAKVEAWVYKVSKNILLKDLIKLYRNDDNLAQYNFEREREIDDVDQENIIVNMWKIINESDIFDAIEKVILQGHYIDGKELKSIAEELKKTPNAIYIKKSRLIEKIKKIMEGKNIKNMKDLDF